MSVARPRQQSSPTVGRQPQVDRKTEYKIDTKAILALASASFPALSPNGKFATKTVPEEDMEGPHVRSSFMRDMQQHITAYDPEQPLPRKASLVQLNTGSPIARYSMPTVRSTMSKNTETRNKLALEGQSFRRASDIGKQKQDDHLRPKQDAVIDYSAYIRPRRASDKGNNATEGERPQTSARPVTAAARLRSRKSIATGTLTASTTDTIERLRRARSVSVPPPAQRPGTAPVSSRPAKFDFQHVHHIMSLPPHERTQADLKALCGAVRSLKAFSHLSEFVLRQLCGVMVIDSFEAGRNVFRQGEIGTAWYVILVGSIEVKISKSGRPEDSKTVAKLEVGQGFGDLALVNDAPRAATISTVTACEFARVEKSEYNRVLRFVHESTIKDSVLFLERLPWLKEWSTIALKQLAGVIKWQTYQDHATIIAEGDKIEHMYILRQGKCDIFRRLTLEGGKTTSVKVGSIGAGEYFGEYGAIGPKAANAIFTLVAAEPEVQIGLISVHDALSKLADVLELSPFIAWDTARLQRQYKHQQDEQYWKNYRQGILSQLAKEQAKDPSATFTYFLDNSHEHERLRGWH